MQDLTLLINKLYQEHHLKKEEWIMLIRGRRQNYPGTCSLLPEKCATATTGTRYGSADSLNLPTTAEMTAITAVSAPAIVRQNATSDTGTSSFLLPGRISAGLSHFRPPGAERIFGLPMKKSVRSCVLSKKNSQTAQ